jgi:hypothetical protein
LETEYRERIADLQLENVALRAILQRCDSSLHIPEVHSPKHCLAGRCGTCRSMAECSICALLWPQFVATLRTALSGLDATPEPPAEVTK